MPNNDVNIKGVCAFLGILAVTLVVAYGILAVMLHAFERDARQADEKALRRIPPATASQRPFFPLPREQPDPVVDLQKLRAQEEVELNSYGWINRTAGVVRIPIDRAIEVLTPPRK